jgi:hypothetical protein
MALATDSEGRFNCADAGETRFGAPFGRNLLGTQNVRNGDPPPQPAAAPQAAAPQAAAPQAAAPQAAAPQAAEPHSWLFLLNFFLFWALVLIAWWWCFRFTIYFAVPSFLAALWAILTYPANFLLSWLQPAKLATATEPWKEFVVKLLSAPVTTTVAIALLTIEFVSILCFVGGIDVHSKDKDVRDVFIYSATASKSHPARLKSEEHHREPFPTFWWSRAQRLVQVSGYPRISVTVSPFERRDLVSPDTFLTDHPVLLCRPTPRLHKLLGINRGAALWIEVHGTSPLNSRVVHDYDGDSYWIGCDASVAVPDRIWQAWEKRDEYKGAGSLFTKWRTPKELPDPDWRLVSGKELEFSIYTVSDHPFATCKVTIQPPTRPDQFPQEAIIDAPP